MRSSPRPEFQQITSDLVIPISDASCDDSHPVIVLSALFLFLFYIFGYCNLGICSHSYYTYLLCSSFIFLAPPSFLPSSILALMFIFFLLTPPLLLSYSLLHFFLLFLHQILPSFVLPLFLAFLALQAIPATC